MKRNAVMSRQRKKFAAVLHTCIRCGCDDNHACSPDGCYWVKGLVDVCSECATGSELRHDAAVGR